MCCGVASAVENMYAAFNDAVWIVVILGIIILLFSLGLSMYLTRQLIRPLGDMVAHIDDIEQHIPYQELRPFAFAIKEQQAKNLEVGRMRQEFTANVSHELKTPADLHLRLCRNDRKRHGAPGGCAGLCRQDSS